MECKNMISYFAHEGELARQERKIRCLWIACLIGAVALAASNAAWAFYWFT